MHTILLQRLLLSAQALLLLACASAPERHAHPIEQQPTLTATGSSSHYHRNTTYSNHRSIHRKNQAALATRLRSHYRQWRGTPYHFGGMSKRGVDCSGFVSLTFANVLGFTPPRTTAQLLRSGKQISAKKRAVGDLVFFNTGGGRRHVGIYMGDGEFIHASSSKGVIASSLHSPYWSKAYRQSRRYIAAGY